MRTTSAAAPMAIPAVAPPETLPEEPVEPLGVGTRGLDDDCAVFVAAEASSVVPAGDALVGEGLPTLSDDVVDKLEGVRLQPLKLGGWHGSS